MQSRAIVSVCASVSFRLGGGWVVLERCRKRVWAREREKRGEGERECDRERQRDSDKETERHTYTRGRG